MASWPPLHALIPEARCDRSRTLLGIAGGLLGSPPPRVQRLDWNRTMSFITQSFKGKGMGKKGAEFTNADRQEELETWAERRPGLIRAVREFADRVMALVEEARMSRPWMTPAARANVLIHCVSGATGAAGKRARWDEEEGGGRGQGEAEHSRRRGGAEAGKQLAQHKICAIWSTPSQSLIQHD